MTEILKNDTVEVTVESLGYKGEGVARIGRVPVFVAGVLPGERVRAHVILVKKDFIVAKPLEILRSSPDRVSPRCPYFGKCGGCDIQHLAYAAQTAWKRESVADALRKIAHLTADVSPCVPSDRAYGYRNKLSLPVRKGKDGAAVGLFAYNSHRIVEIDDCPLQTERVRAFLPVLKKIATAFVPYDEESGRGELRHFSLRDLGGRLSLTAVVTSDLSEKIRRVCENTGADEVWINVNRSRGNVILGEETRLLLGTPVPHEIMGLPSFVHPKAFLQVNENVMRKLYGALRDAVAAVRPRRLIDAYSGGGTLTALLAPFAEEAIGVEIERAAVQSADDLMKRAGIRNVRNICGDCAAVLPELVSGTGADTIVLLDPPRGGCDAAVTEAVNACGASRVLYVSCNPSTLARDLALLPAYEIVSVTPFDMFPQTKHVETLVALERKPVA